MTTEVTINTAGHYRDRVIRLVHSSTKSPTSGQEEPTYTAGSTYWAKIKPLNAKEQLQFGLLGSTVEVQILVRNNVVFSFQDRIQDKATNAIYQITGVYYDFDNMHTVIDAVRWRNA